jgi:hypothetical protein
MRVDAHPLTPRQSSALYQEAGKPFSFSIQRSFLEGNSVGDEWWSRVNSGDGKVLVHEAGAVIEMFVQWKGIPPLAQRVLDAMSWFGQAASDPAPGTRLLKYVAAVERLTLYGKESRITAKVCERVATLCCKDGGRDFNSLSKRMREIYKARSELTHGKWSPYADSLSLKAYRAEGIVQDVIFNFLSLAVGAPLRDAAITNASMRKVFVKFKEQKLAKSN